MLLTIKMILAATVIMATASLLGSLWYVKNPNEEKGLGMFLVMGIITMFGIFQLLAVPMIFLKIPHRILTISWCSVILILCVISIIKQWKLIVNIKHVVKEKLARKWKGTGVWYIFFALLFFQIIVTAGTYTAHEDDNRYVAEVVDTYETGTMLQYHPFTSEFYGEPQFELLKDAVAPINMFWATICVIFGIHPAILMHIFIPILAIPLCYYVYYRIGIRLTKGNYNQCALFLIVLWLFFMSNHTTPLEGPGRLLYYMWWGKSWLSAFFIPLVIELFLGMMSSKKVTRKDYIILGSTMLGACLTTSMAPILLPLMVGVYGIVDMILNKQIKRFLIPIFVCIPTLIYGVIFFLVDRV